jgi:hypothetical protein
MAWIAMFSLLARSEKYRQKMLHKMFKNAFICLSLDIFATARIAPGMSMTLFLMPDWRTLI